jgi:excisionase family DNA binding protein
MTDDTTAAMLTTGQVARRLGVSAERVLEYIADGQLRAYRLGHRTVRVDPADLARFLTGRATAG